MSSTNLAAKGHQIINTNSNWYYVLGSSGSTIGWATYEHAAADTKTISVTTTIGGATAVGSVLAFWCDTPSVVYGTNEQAKLMALIETLDYGGNYNLVKLGLVAEAAAYAYDGNAMYAKDGFLYCVISSDVQADRSKISGAF